MGMPSGHVKWKLPTNTLIYSLWQRQINTGLLNIVYWHLVFSAKLFKFFPYTENVYQLMCTKHKASDNCEVHR